MKKANNQKKQNTRKKVANNNVYSQAEIDAAMAQAEMLTALSAGFLGELFGPVNFGNAYNPNSTGSPIRDAVLGVNQPCVFCGGSGICSSCEGTGKEIRRNYDYDIDDSWGTYQVDCSHCYGSGKCSNCNGTGRT